MESHYDATSFDGSVGRSTRMELFQTSVDQVEYWCTYDVVTCAPLTNFGYSILEDRDQARPRICTLVDGPSCVRKIP